MSLLEKREQAERILSNIAKLSVDLTKLRQQLQRDCPHLAIVEMESYASILGGHPPRRICIICSLEEDGWAFNKLNDGTRILKVVHPDRNSEFYKYRNFLSLEDEVSARTLQKLKEL